MQKKIYLLGLVIAICIVGVFLFWLQVNVLVRKSDTHGKKQLTVVTSFYPLYFFAKEIAQDKADIQNITPTGAEPHDYVPTPREMAKIEKSDILIINGEGLEAWAKNIETRIDPNVTMLVVAGRDLATRSILEDEGVTTDPHVWLSPVLAQRMVEKIELAFTQSDPINKDFYQQNATVLQAKLAELDRQYREGLAFCSERNIITSHMAFGYIAETYGLEQISIAGLTPEAEPSPKELGDIVDFAKKNNVHTIFFESLASPKLAETIAKEIGAETSVLNPLEGLSDGEVASGDNYFTVMENNLTQLKKALRCNQ